ncbi:COX15/CtaA family protein [Devosia ginsengisoli]|uniref:COX15/CtaA family protein n=1 Tax=Devosia ginsengisoli TaxID=400770 RepID=UPI0026EA4ACF|nr:COX15/CtaA family protein [Devosia ginsengisoli]MCR6672908.1 COX15/CtaA family protein [Devosia ginsengisoli]
MTTIQNAALSQITIAGDRLRPVRIWLYVMALMVLCMVMVGGMTRLTGSGLSITTWRPISGIIPPLNEADWLAEFAGYKLIPQYDVYNHWMTLEDFKGIFWWEWIHRFLGRMIGFAFAIPFVVFLVQKRLTRDMAVPLACLFLLGGFQGFLGWWMVSSGLTELTSVSQYRLATHLTAAALLLLALIWVARRMRPQPTEGVVTRFNVVSIALLLVLLVIQIAAGGFVAGIDAGMGYNTWPLMEGKLIPDGLGAYEPGWRSMFEHGLTVQFNHRMLAYFIATMTAVLLVLQARRAGLGGVHRWLVLIAVLVLAQVGLGIATLLSMVQIDLAVSHQGLAFVLASAVCAYLADLTKTRSLGTTR